MAEPVVGEWNELESSTPTRHSSPWSVFWGILKAVNRSLIAIITFMVCWVAFTSEKVQLFHLHLSLSAIGYQFLMAEAILTMSSDSSWSMFLSRDTKKVVHLTLGGLGSILAITGSSIMIYQRGAHFKSPHAILGLSSLVLVCVTAINGPITYFAGRLNRRVKPVYMSLYHSSVSCITFCVGVACLITGYKQRWFKNKVSKDMLLCLTIFSSITIVLTLTVPLINMIKLIWGRLRKQ